VDHVPDPMNFKLKTHVDLTTSLTTELDSTAKEVEFWQEKYEEAMKTIRKLKYHCPQDMENKLIGSTSLIESFVIAIPLCEDQLFFVCAANV
jgi:hypothetical protein